jgi:SSS family solute:Na+ symporter
MAASIFVILFAGTIAVGFLSARWKQTSLASLSEWSLAGRSIGPWISWFLVGGDLYTAYTFIAIPALLFSAGALGFYAIPYTIVCYPLLFLILPKLWQVAQKHGYVTGPEYVRGRFGNRWLALAIGITGIVATMPYIALQLVGTQVIFGALGFTFGWNLPIVISFLLLAGFSCFAGLRASALISIIKGVLIFATVLVAIVVIPMHLGGYAGFFAKVDPSKLLLPAATAANWGQFSAYGTLALGSAIALFLYPHALTGLLSAASANVIKRNAMTLPAFTLLLGFVALLGFMALAAGVAHDPAFAEGFRQYGASFAVPAIIMASFPSWFVGVAFAAIAIGALVPASIMAIGSANIIVRDVWTMFAPWRSEASEATAAKVFAALMVVAGLLFMILIPMKDVVNFQLLGGIWISQTFPALALSLFWRRAFTGWGLFVGWLVGVVSGTWMVISLGFAGSVFSVHVFGVTIPSYIALVALVLNIVVSFVLTPFLRTVDKGSDETADADYEQVRHVPSTVPGTPGLRPAL